MNKKNGLTLIILSAILLDVLFIVIADLASFIIRFNGVFPANNFNAYSKLASFIITLRLGTFYIFGFYEKPKYKSNFEILINTIKAATASSIIIIFFLYFLTIDAYPRSIAFLSWILTIILISSWRLVVKEVVGVYLGKDFFCAHLLVLGTGREAYELAMHALRDSAIDYKLIGFVKTEKNASVEVEKSQILGTIDDMPRILDNFNVDEIIIAEAALERRKLIGLSPLLNKNNITLKSAPSAYDRVITSIMLSKVEAFFVGPTFFKKPSTWYWGIKRMLDVAASFIILVLISPVMLLVMVLIKTTSPGPILYFQKRTGQNGRNFVIYKLRTMYTGAEKGGHPRWAKKSDTRITPVGKLLRRYRIDELPQLVNVLRNDMSLIGPRPERPYFTNVLIKKIPFYAHRLQIKPGISGWAQVNFKYSNSEKDAERKLLYDLFYVQNMSFALDLLVALKTLKVIATGEGAQ